jgi:hypothetical protein
MGKDIEQRIELPDEMPQAFTHDGHEFALRGDRIVRDGTEVCVLVSYGYGAGFCSWNEEVSPFEPKIVAIVLAGQKHALADADPGEVAAWLGIDHVYLGGASGLQIEYLPLGTRFRIDEYDGAESLVTSAALNHTA